MRKIVLASTSPRRQEILAYTKLPFATDSPDYTEDMTIDMRPAELVQHLSLGKARSLLAKHPYALIIGGDSIVVSEGRVLGKPYTPAKARQMLAGLSGRQVSVFTGVAVVDTATGRSESRAVETKVYFKSMSPNDIDNYIATGEPLDRAGAFALQGLGAVFIEKIEGDYLGAIGLPLAHLVDLLNRFGVDALTPAPSSASRPAVS